MMNMKYFLCLVYLVYFGTIVDSAPEKGLAQQLAQVENEVTSLEGTLGVLQTKRAEGTEPEGHVSSVRGDEEMGIPGKTVDKVLSSIQEQALAEFYTENPKFYDKSLEHYKDTKKKGRLLQQKADELGMTAKDTPRWHKAASSSFGRSGHGASNMTPRQRWFWIRCKFLLNHIYHRSRQTTVFGQVPQKPSSESVAHSDDDGAESLEEDDGKTGSFAVSASVKPARVSKAPKKIKETSIVDSAILDFIKTSQTQGIHLQAKVDEALTSTDELDNWIRWVSLALKPLPRHLWREFYEESYALVMRYVRQAYAQQPLLSTPGHQFSQQQPFQSQHTYRPQFYEQQTNQSQPSVPYIQQPFQSYQHLQHRPASNFHPSSKGNVQPSTTRHSQWGGQDINIPLQASHRPVSDTSLITSDEFIGTGVGTSSIIVSIGETSTSPMKTFTSLSSVSKAALSSVKSSSARTSETKMQSQSSQSYGESSDED